MRRLIALSYLPVKYKATANIQLGKIGTEKRLACFIAGKSSLNLPLKISYLGALFRLLCPYKKNRKQFKLSFIRGVILVSAISSW